MAYKNYFHKAVTKVVKSLVLAGSNRDGSGPEITRQSDTAVNVPGLAIGGTLLTATPAELNLVDAAPATVAFSPAAGGANVCEVTVVVRDAAGVAIAAPFVLDLWLSDAASGVGLTGTAASGTVTAKAASGAVLSTYTAKKDLRVQTLANGVFILEITDTAKTAFRVCVTNPTTGKAVVSAALITANYG